MFGWLFGNKKKKVKKKGPARLQKNPQLTPKRTSEQPKMRGRQPLAQHPSGKTGQQKVEDMGGVQNVASAIRSLLHEDKMKH